MYSRFQVQHQAYWCPTGADPGFRFGGRSSVEGARIEAPQAPNGVGWGMETGVHRGVHP